jgi:hypothetical protein
MHWREQLLVLLPSCFEMRQFKAAMPLAALKLAKEANDKMMVQLQFGHVIDCKIIIRENMSRHVN